MDFQGPERTASAFYYWAARNIPHGVKKIYKIEDIPGWIDAVCPLYLDSDDVLADETIRTRTNREPFF